MLRRLSIATKLALASVLLISLSGLAIDWLSASQLESSMIQRIRAELSSKLSLLEDVARAQGATGARGPAEWDSMADRFGRQAGVRVTLIAQDGTVVGDSEVPLAELGEMENHAFREEIAFARDHGEGSAIRASPTLHVRMIYAARRYPAPEEGIAVLRLAVPLTEVDAAVAGSRRLLAFSGAAALLVGLLMSLLGTYWLTTPVRRITGAAQAMAAGRLDARAPARGEDEIAKLGEALNRLASELASTIHDLRADRDLLASMLEGMGEGVLVVDADRRIVLANRALRQLALLGAEARGRSILETIRNASLQEAIERAAASDEPVVRELELAGVLPRRLLVRVSRLGGEPDAGCIAVFHDVTELRRLETMRTDFVANVSHELRTPVTAIGTAVETLLDGALANAADAREFAEMIDRNAKRLRQLVDDLLDLSKMESKGFRANLVAAEIAPVIEHAALLLREPARKRQVSIKLRQSDEAMTARIDRRVLEQVVLNLLDNAVKYAGAGAHVEVRTRPTGSHIEIAVSDDGPGIPRAHLGRIFERFYRVDAGRSRDVGGTGLGLSIVKHLVELMHGTIDVESEIGKGAAFTVRLPRAP